MNKDKKVFKVNGKPFFVLGAQCGTNNTYFREDLKDYWRAAEALRLNTAELHAFWELLEPEEGKFDYSQIDMLIDECRIHNVKLIIIWFASWKNATLKYAPEWVKADRKRFWRVTGSYGNELLVMSPHCEETRKADTRAFLKLVGHIKEVDSEEKTVIGIQVQNECGILGNARRDHHEEVNREFLLDVPSAFIDYISIRETSPVYQTWKANGCKRTGNWNVVFGRDGEEFFTALALAKYIGREIAEAKKVYDLPMYVNVWMMEQELERPSIDYPCGGPVTKVIDIWKFGAPAIDFIAPDVYSNIYSCFNRDCSSYDRDDNPLYIPEAASLSSTNWAPFAAVGNHNCIGFSCMGKVYNIVGEDGNIAENRAGMVQSFCDMSYVAPMLPKYYGTGKIYPVIQDDNMEQQLIKVDGWDILVLFHRFDKYNYPIRTQQRPLDHGAGLIIQTGTNEFYAVGSNFTLEMHQSQPVNEIWPDWTHLMSTSRLGTRSIGYMKVEEGYFDEDDNFIVFNRRNGDSTDRGILFLPKTKVLHFIMDPDM